MLYFRRGKSGLWFVPTIANTAAPTAAEITAGTNLSVSVIAVSNFETSLNRINQGVMAYEQEVQLAGPQTFQDASLTILEDDGTGSDADSTARQAAQTALVDLATGYFVFSPKKPGTLASADKVEVWPVQVVTKNRDWSLETQAARFSVPVVITAPPNKNAVVA